MALHCPTLLEKKLANLVLFQRWPATSANKLKGKLSFIWAPKDIKDYISNDNE